MSIKNSFAASIYIPLLQPDGEPVFGSLGESLSGNWSGYAARGQRFTSASGRWTVPNITYNSSGGGAAQTSSIWVGIGGDRGDPTLIQLGTQQEIGPSGTSVYSAWYEILPDNAVFIPTFHVLPGDVIEASLQCDPSAKPYTRETWQLVLRNLTQNAVWTKAVPYTSSLATAEWIVEAVEVNGKISVLPNYESVTFTNMVANGKIPSLTLGKNGIAMVDGNGKRISSPSRALPGTFTAMFGATTPASPSPYVIAPLDVPELYMRSFYLSGINDTQTVLGYLSTGQDINSGFLFDIDLQFGTFSYAANETTQAYGINGHGTVVGISVHRRGNGVVFIPFLYDGTNFSVLKNFPPATPTGLNNAGTVVGFGGKHGFIYQNGSFLTVDYPEKDVSTVCTGINNKGQIVGLYHGKDHPPAGFIYSGGQFSPPIKFPGAISTYPTGINDEGRVAGHYWDGEAARGFTYFNGQYTGFDPAPYNLVEVAGINNLGQIVGKRAMASSSDDYRVFLAYNPERSPNLRDGQGKTNLLASRLG
jgi:hypothetical protein